MLHIGELSRRNRGSGSGSSETSHACAVSGIHSIRQGMDMYCFSHLPKNQCSFIDDSGRVCITALRLNLGFKTEKPTFSAQYGHFQCLCKCLTDDGRCECARNVNNQAFVTTVDVSALRLKFRFYNREILYFQLNTDIFSVCM